MALRPAVGHTLKPGCERARQGKCRDWRLTTSIAMFFSIILWWCFVLSRFIYRLRYCDDSELHEDWWHSRWRSLGAIMHSFNAAPLGSSCSRCTAQECAVVSCYMNKWHHSCLVACFLLVHCHNNRSIVLLQISDDLLIRLDDARPAPCMHWQSCHVLLSKNWTLVSVAPNTHWSDYLLDSWTRPKQSLMFFSVASCNGFLS